MKKVGHEFNDIDERLVGNEQKLFFTMQKFSQIVGVRAKKKVVNAREKKVTPFVTTLMFVNNFPKSFETTSGSLEFASGSVVRYPCCCRLYQPVFSLPNDHTKSKKQILSVSRIKSNTNKILEPAVELGC